MNLYSIKVVATALFVSVLPFLSVSCSEDTVVDVVREDGVYSYTMYLGDDWSGFGEETRASGHTWDDQDVLYLSFSNFGNNVIGKGVYNKSANVWNIEASGNLQSASGASCSCYYFRGNPKDSNSIVTVDGKNAIFGDANAFYSFDGTAIYAKAAIKPLSWRLRFKGTEGQTLVVKGSSGISNQLDRKTGILSSATNVDDVELTVQKDGYTPYVYGRYNGSSTSAQLKIESNDFTYERIVSSSDLSIGKSGYFAIPTLDNHNSWTVKAGDHEFVDLGLPSGTLWATCNIGANSPEEPGDKYALGEVETKSEYTKDNYHYSFSDIFERIQSIDQEQELDLYSLKEENDVAAEKWGIEWSMPSLYEAEELCKYCTQEEVTIGDKKLIKHTSIKNGNSIYLLEKGLCWIKSAMSSPEGITIFAMPARGSYNKFEFSSACAGAIIRPICHSLPIIYPRSADIADIKDSSLSMTIGESRKLNVSVLPEAASFKFGEWQSDDTKVVKVNENGEVTAVGKGKTTVTFSDPTGILYKASCSIEVSESHEFVDLGLPSGLKWATCNVGANSPEEYGDYFAWGETEPKDDYSYYNYKHGSGEYCIFTKYTIEEEYSCNGIDNKYILDPEDDAAYVNWGPGWRMPTEGDLRELYDKCGWEVTTKNGICGYRVTGPNDKTIFLPAAGWKRNEVCLSRVRNDKSPASRRNLKGEENSIYDFFYWSSSLWDYYSASSWSYEDEEGRGVCISDWPRYIGMPVRPVVRE